MVGSGAAALSSLLIHHDNRCHGTRYVSVHDAGTDARGGDLGLLQAGVIPGKFGR
jgi:hypothetical protein